MTSAPPSPPLTPVKKSRLRKWLRRILYFVAGLLLLTTVFYWVESFRGSYALQKAADAFEADYESFDLRQFLTKRPPDAENFGATPLLDGLMGSDDFRTHEGQEIRKRNDSLTKLWAGEFEEDGLYGISCRSYRDHWERQRDKESGRTPVSYSGPIDWKELRGSLLSRKKYLPPVNEPSDVRAVDKALDQEQALFEELRAASRRRYSVFTPAPADRENLEFTTLTPISLRKEREWNVPGLRALIRVRAMTAAILGRTEEAVELAHVLWKFREACLAEPGLGPYFLTKRLEVYWRACVREISCSPGVNDAALKHLLEQPGEGFSQEKEFLLALRSDAALTYSWWQESIRMAEGTFSKESRVEIVYPTDRNFSGREETIVGWCPVGWLSQNAAFDLKEMHLHCIKPLRTGGFPVLPAAGEAALKEEGPWCRYYYVYMKFGRGAGINNLLRASVFYSTRMSQTLLALGMERYRLKNHRYPQDVNALVPDFLAKLPVDIDGLPLRTVTSVDGSTAVISSVGWNLTDDWHGTLPGDYDETNYEKNADWAIALPFPPLPIP